MYRFLDKWNKDLYMDQVQCCKSHDVSHNQPFVLRSPFSPPTLIRFPFFAGAWCLTNEFGQQADAQYQGNHHLKKMSFR